MVKRKRTTEIIVIDDFNDDDAAARIAKTSERLFSEFGVDSISMREISVQAGCGDNNAVQYHFGSKDNLLKAIFLSRVSQMEPARNAMLDRAEELGVTGDPGTLFSILFLPHLDLQDEQGNHPYAGFLMQLATRLWSKNRHEWTSAAGAMPGLTRLMARLTQLVDDPRPEVRSIRIMMHNMMFVSGLNRWDNSDGDERRIYPLDERIRDVIRICASSLVPGPLQDAHIATSTREWLACHS